MEILSKNQNDLKTMLLIYEAKRWLRFTESGGDNRGQLVEAFQKAVDGKAIGEPWCMAFVQYCIKQVDFIADELMGLTAETQRRSQLFSTEHCLTCWHRSPSDCHVEIPMPGTVMIWQKGTTSAGHCGILVSIDADDPDYVWTIEGNTGPQEVVTREGDGVYLKRRSINVTGNMKVMGWLNPWF